MTLRLALLCPGQGAQHANMFDLVPITLRNALFAQWGLGSVLGMSAEQALSDTRRYANRIAQPLIAAAALAQWEVLRDLLPRPHLILGYSAGELSAYGIAQAAAPAIMLDIAKQRAELMDACAIGHAQGLMAITGVRLERLQAKLIQHGLHVAIMIGEDSTIVGGLIEHLNHLKQALKPQGARMQLLPVTVASHTSQMQAAVVRLARLLECNLKMPSLPVVAGVSAQIVATKQEAVDTLARQTAQTIRWAECMDTCAESGITAALELGPGTALSRMLQARHPKIACRSVDDFRSLGGVQAWIERQV